MESKEPLPPDSYAPSAFFRALFVWAPFRLSLPSAKSSAPPAPNNLRSSSSLRSSLLLEAGFPPPSGPRRSRARRARASSERAGQPPAPPHSRASASRCSHRPLARGLRRDPVVDEVVLREDAREVSEVEPVDQDLAQDVAVVERDGQIPLVEIDPAQAG